jgi:hypothetical protein
MLSADVSNGLNPDFYDNNIYADGMVPSLNKGMCVATDPNGDMTTTSRGLVVGRMINDWGNSNIIGGVGEMQRESAIWKVLLFIDAHWDFQCSRIDLMSGAEEPSGLCCSSGWGFLLSIAARRC